MVGSEDSTHPTKTRPLWIAFVLFSFFPDAFFGFHEPAGVIGSFLFFFGSNAGLRHRANGRALGGRRTFVGAGRWQCGGHRLAFESARGSGLVDGFADLSLA